MRLLTRIKFLPSNLKGIILVAMLGSSLVLLAGCSSYMDDKQVCIAKDDSCRKKQQAPSGEIQELPEEPTTAK